MIDLIEPIRDMSVHTTALNLFTNQVVTEGRFAGSVRSDGTYNWWRVSSPRPLTLIVRAVSNADVPDAPTVYDEDGGVIAARLDAASTTRRILSYDLGPAPSGLRFRIAHGLNNTHSYGIVIHKVSIW